MVSRNCLKCGKAGYVNPRQLPDLVCENCESGLKVEKVDGSNYFYVCGQCQRDWMLASVLPKWSELFDYSGLAAHGDFIDDPPYLP